MLWFFHYYLAKELNGLSLSAALAWNTQLICALGEKATWGLFTLGPGFWSPLDSPVQHLYCMFKSQEIKEDVRCQTSQDRRAGNKPKTDLIRPHSFALCFCAIFHRNCHLRDTWSQTGAWPTTGSELRLPRLPPGLYADNLEGWRHFS